MALELGTLAVGGLVRRPEGIKGDAEGGGKGGRSREPSGRGLPSAQSSSATKSNRVRFQHIKHIVSGSADRQRSRGRA